MLVSLFWLWLLLETLRQPSMVISSFLCGLIMFHLVSCKQPILSLIQVQHLFSVQFISWWLCFFLSLHTKPSFEHSCSSDFKIDSLLSYNHSPSLENYSWPPFSNNTLCCLGSYTIFSCFHLQASYLFIWKPMNIEILDSYFLPVSASAKILLQLLQSC